LDEVDAMRRFTYVDGIFEVVRVYAVNSFDVLSFLIDHVGGGEEAVVNTGGEACENEEFW